MLAFDGNDYLIEMLLIAKVAEAGADLLGGLLTKFQRPLAYRFVRDCRRRLNIDPPYRSKIDPGRVAEI